MPNIVKVDIETELTKLQNSESRELARNRLGIAGLIALARSWALVLPRDWVDLNCDLIEQEDGKPIPWVQFEEGDEDDTLIIRPMTREVLAKILTRIVSNPEKGK